MNVALSLTRNGDTVTVTDADGFWRFLVFFLVSLPVRLGVQEEADSAFCKRASGSRRWRFVNLRRLGGNDRFFVTVTRSLNESLSFVSEFCESLFDRRNYCLCLIWFQVWSRIISCWLCVF